ncbi:MAG: hypothetical protein IKI50_05705 [Clostridia bacterium]|nr:hypothetical protein [Clostridia bacterium]
MKKYLVCLLSLFLVSVLALTFTSCGNGGQDQTDSDSPLTRNDSEPNAPASDLPIGGNIDFSSIMAGSGSTDTVWGQQDAASRQQIIEAARAEGYDVSFGADGSMTVKGEDGTVVVQKPDGTWTMQDKDGSSAQLGGSWPDNEFTRLVPRPDFTLAGASTEEDTFTAAFQSVELEQVKAYANQLKASGFTEDPEEVDQNAYGVIVYTYSAHNADDVYVEITFASGVSGLTIRK